MKEIDVGHFKKDITAALEDMPFTITRRGVPIATVVRYQPKVYGKEDGRPVSWSEALLLVAVVSLLAGVSLILALW